MNEESRHNRPTSIALVLETNNLRSADDIDEVVDELEELFAQLRRQTLPLAELSEVVVTHDGLPARARRRVQREVDRPLEWCRIGADIGYYEAKNTGFDATDADIVVFGDADCRPVRRWLECLTAPIREEQADVVAGRTVYPDGPVPAAGTAIDFQYHSAPDAPSAVRNFYANNVAFRAEVFDAYRYRTRRDLYRGHCLDLAVRLHDDDVPIVYARDAKSTHEWPDRLGAVLRKRLVRGADASQVAPEIVSAHVPDPLADLLDTDHRAAAAILVGRCLYALEMLESPTLEVESTMERRTAQVAALLMSAVDSVGALLRLGGVTRFGVADGRRLDGDHPQFAA